MEILFLIIGLLAGAVAAWFAAKAKFGSGMEPQDLERQYVHREAHRALESQVDVYKADLAEKEQELRESASAISAKEQIIINLEEKLYGQKQEMDNMHKMMEERFANLAERLFEEKGRKFSLQNQEQVTNLLNPFREKFREFEENIEKRYWEETKERISLKKEIEQLRDLNMQLSDDANSLVNALKGDNKVQGDWGEFQLEVLLEKAGLERGVQFSTQQSFLNGDGRQHRPDFIIHLPEGKHLIIDSKVSLKAYEAFFSASSDEERRQRLAAHVASLRNHIKDLSGKNYPSLRQLNSPDYLLMFIPVEPALTVALQEDSRLFLEALDRNIVLVSTTTLLATMRTVSFIWKQEKQKKNVLEIARQSGLLYDKFCSFTDDLKDIGKRLEQAQNSYDTALRKFSESSRYGDTLVGRAERIKKLGAKTNKSLPQDLLDGKE